MPACVVLSAKQAVMFLYSHAQSQVHCCMSLVQVLHKKATSRPDLHILPLQGFRFSTATRIYIVFLLLVVFLPLLKMSIRICKFVVSSTTGKASLEEDTFTGLFHMYAGCRLMLAKREAKAVTEADTEALDFWYDLEDDFELLSFKAWNAVIYQVPACLLMLLTSPPYRVQGLS